MKVIGFVSSPRKKGNTAILVEKVLAGAAAAGAETKTYCLNDLNIKGCQACNQCKTNGGYCKQQDDMTPLYEELVKADGIVFSSPVYMSHITAQAKLFFDRWYAFFNPGSPSRLPRGKKLALVFSQGNGDETAFQSAFKSVAGALQGLFGMELQKTLVAVGMNEPGAVAKDSQLLQQAYDLGQQLARQE